MAFFMFDFVSFLMIKKNQNFVKKRKRVKTLRFKYFTRFFLFNVEKGGLVKKADRL